VFWQESDKQENIAVPDDVVDIAFHISCRTLPVDHAWVLSHAVLAELPWIEHETGAGVHTIHVADSGNGWMRPEGADDLLYLSRRTRLVLRVPAHRAGECKTLTGRTLNVAGQTLQVEQASVKPLAANPTIFSRYVVSAPGQDENTFLAAALRELDGLGVHPKKMLCGMEKSLATPNGPVRTRSLMVADLSLPESFILQQRGLGPRRSLGCGLFLPHKDIKEVREMQGS
jgi:CRISPR-associated protein Cas6